MVGNMSLLGLLTATANQLTPTAEPLYLQGPVDGDELDDDQLEELYRFVTRRQECAQAECIEELRRCEYIYRYRDGEGSIRALISFWHVPVEVEGTPYVVQFGKWTLLDPVARGRNLTSICFVDTFIRLRVRYPTRRIFLIIRAATFFAYLMVVRNTRRAYPNRHEPTPEVVRRVQDIAMSRLYDDQYDAEAGIFPGDGEYPFDEGEAWKYLDDPDIATFYEHNPGQEDGDKLAVTVACDPKALVQLAGNMSRRIADRLLSN